MADVSALTLRLLGEEAVRERLALLAERAGAAGTAPGILATSPCWPAVRDVIRRAITQRRPTLVYGDYDVDGSVASFMLFRYLRSQAVPGNVFLPSRFKHGYGLDRATIDQAIGQGYTTLLALDCGTANIEEIAAAVAGGMDVAIIDHHTPKTTLPPVPLLNPHLDPALPPLCTAGLIYEVLRELEAAGGAPVAGDELELAGLATIADVVPLEPHNWALAHEALARLPATANPGLAELIKISRLHGLDRLTAQQVAFQLVPRLNSGGRMRSARVVLDLLGAADATGARQMAAEVDRLNEQRKLEGEHVFRKAVLQSEEFTALHAVVLYGSEWHIGVLGIVAARIAESLLKPAIILTDDPREPGVLSGSARTAGGVNLIEALQHNAPLLASFGGHAQAAGVRLKREHLAEFREAWSSAVAAGCLATPQLPAPDYPEVALHELTAAFEQDLWRLAPFGAGYPTPRCVLTGCRVSRVSLMGRDRTHLNLSVTDGARETRIAAFNQSHLQSSLRVGASVRPIVEIDADNWNNANTITLRLLAVDLA